MPLTISSASPNVPSKTIVPPYEHLEQLQELKKNEHLAPTAPSKGEKGSWMTGFKRVFKMK